MMSIRCQPISLAVLSLLGLAQAGAQELRDPFFGESLFYAEQGRYFDALERMDSELAQHYRVDEPELDTLYLYVNDAEFAVGDFELNYRMHHRAGRAITAVLEGDVSQLVRNDAAYRLARIHFQKAQFEDALNALGRIEGDIPPGLDDDIQFLQANVFLATGRAPEAMLTLERIDADADLLPFTAYNSGIALLDNGNRDAALAQLERAGLIAATDNSSLAIRDKANLVLGSLLMEAGQFARAQASFDRVSLEGPLSNQALLNSGWASLANTDYERALVPWGLLAQREDTDSAVQEAKLALPYAYAQSGVHGRAALLYGNALTSFDEELVRVNDSISSIRRGRFLEALVREEIRQDGDWVIRLRDLPESPETYYLMELVASHDFQTALQNYLDLEDLRARLSAWERDFDSFDGLIAARRDYYEPILPEIDQQFRRIDSRIRLRVSQHYLLEQRLQDLLTTPRPEMLATGEERMTRERLIDVLVNLSADGGTEAGMLAARAARLKGALEWDLQTEYHNRLTTYDTHLRDLQVEIDVMLAQYERFIRIRQAAVHSYEGYSDAIENLRERVITAAATVDNLMQRQGRIIETVAIDTLIARRELLTDYRNQASYAMADSYDRATQAQEREVSDDGVQPNRPVQSIAGGIP